MPHPLPGECDGIPRFLYFYDETGHENFTTKDN